MATKSHPNVQCAPGACGGGGPTLYFYGADENRMNQATAEWPQDEWNWCGISNIQAIEWYDWLKTGSNYSARPGKSPIELTVSKNTCMLLPLVGYVEAKLTE